MAAATRAAEKEEALRGLKEAEKEGTRKLKERGTGTGRGGETVDPWCLRPSRTLMALTFSPSSELSP